MVMVIVVVVVMMVVVLMIIMTMKCPTHPWLKSRASPSSGTGILKAGTTLKSDDLPIPNILFTDFWEIATWESQDSQSYEIAPMNKTFWFFGVKLTAYKNKEMHFLG